MWTIGGVDKPRIFTGCTGRSVISRSCLTWFLDDRDYEREAEAGRTDNGADDDDDDDRGRK